MTVEVVFITRNSLDTNIIKTLLPELAAIEHVVGCKDDKGMLIRAELFSNENKFIITFERITLYTEDSEFKSTLIRLSEKANIS